MAHFTRTQSNATWTTGNYITLVTDWADLSRKLFKSINGVRGGTWAPLVRIVFGGSGFKVSGLTKIGHGGQIKTTVGARVVVSGSNYPHLANGHAGNTRKIATSTIGRQSSIRYHWLLNTKYQAIQSIACTLIRTGINLVDEVEQPRFNLPLRVHNGGRLTMATLYYRIFKERTALPVKTPRVRIVRVDSVGTIQPMTSQVLGADANGWLPITTPGSPEEWYANGEMKSFTVVCDQLNTIDTGNYQYYAEVIEEVGTEDLPDSWDIADGFLIRAGRSVTAVHSSNNNIDTVPAGLTAADRVLKLSPGSTVIDDGYWAAINGVWWVDPGPWTRVALVTPNQFTTGYLVIVRNSDEAWELIGPNKASNPQIYLGTTSPGGSADIGFRARRPNGNIYHSFVCEFDSIADMRPQ